MFSCRIPQALGDDITVVYLARVHCVGESGRALQGAPGSVLEISVPVGVTVTTDFGTVIGKVLHSSFAYDPQSITCCIMLVNVNA